MTTGPIVLCLLGLLYFGANKLRMRVQHASDDDINAFRNKCTSLFFAFTYLVFPGSSLITFRGFACDNVRFRVRSALRTFAELTRANGPRRTSTSMIATASPRRT